MKSTIPYLEVKMENNYIGYVGYPLPKIPKAINKMAADALIGQLEKGKLPWQKPWTGYESKELAIPTDSGFHRYRGINTLLLWSASSNHGYTCREWDTFECWSQKEEIIRKGEQGTKVIQFHTDVKTRGGKHTEKDSAKLKTVYNRCQLESFRPTQREPYFTTAMIADKEFVIDNFIYEIPFSITFLEHNHGYDYYKDVIRMSYTHEYQPQCKNFGLEYWSTLFPPLIKWSGHPKRTNRPTYVSRDIDAENLVAEIGSAFIAAEFRINAKDNCFNKDPLAGYIKTIKENADNIVCLVNDAAIASEYLFTLQPM